MKRYFIACLGLLTLWTTPVQAQIDIETSVNHTYYLEGEPIKVTLTITNRSGRSLSLAEDPDWIDTVVTDERGQPIPRRSPLYLGAIPVTLPEGSTAAFRFDITPNYDFPHEGRYRVRPSVRFPEWPDPVNAEVGRLHIVSGVSLWKRRFAVTDSEGKASQREYRVMEINRLDGNHLYLQARLADSKRILGVEYLGKLVSFAEPSATIDPSNNAHVLNQFGRISHRYSIVSPDGELLGRQTYKHGPGRPTLSRNEENLVVISGGTLSPNITDYIINETPVHLPPIEIGPVIQ